MADLSYLFGNNAPSTFLATKTDQTNLPAWYQDAEVGLLGQAAAVANEPYTPYTGPRVAGLDPLQTQAIGNAATAGQTGANTMAQGANMAAAGGAGFNQDEFNKYLSPYTSGVVDRIAQLGQQDLTNNILPAVNQSFIGSGLPFGTRHADVTSQALNTSQQNILGQQSSALESAQNNAMSAYNTAMQRQASAGGVLAGIGASQTQNDLQTGGYQNLMGGVAQANQQQNLDTAYGDFQNQLNYPLTQLNDVNAILKGYSPAVSNTTYGTGNSPASTSNNTNVGNSALGALSGFFNNKSA